MDPDKSFPFRPKNPVTDRQRDRERVLEDRGKIQTGWKISGISIPSHHPSRIDLTPLSILMHTLKLTLERNGQLEETEREKNRLRRCVEDEEPRWSWSEIPVYLWPGLVFEDLTGVQHNISGRGGGREDGTTGRRREKMGERSAECERTGERRVQVLFMDYLTCPGYNPPKASIRIIASSSSRLCGCYRPPLRHSLSQPRSASILHPPRHPAPPSLSRDANLHRCVAATPFFYRPSPPLPPPPSSSSQLPLHS